MRQPYPHVSSLRSTNLGQALHGHHKRVGLKRIMVEHFDLVHVTMSLLGLIVHLQTNTILSLEYWKKMMETYERILQTHFFTSATMSHCTLLTPLAKH